MKVECAPFALLRAQERQAASEPPSQPVWIVEMMMARHNTSARPTPRSTEFPNTLRTKRAYRQAPQCERAPKRAIAAISGPFRRSCKTRQSIMIIATFARNGMGDDGDCPRAREPLDVANIGESRRRDDETNDCRQDRGRWHREHPTWAAKTLPDLSRVRPTKGRINEGTIHR